MIRFSVRTSRNVVAAGCLSLITAAMVSATVQVRPFKNIIVMVPDGCDATVQTVARWYLGKNLMVDSMSRGAVKTWMSNSIIPGSAAAGTAFATGFKTTEPFIGVGPRTSDAISTYTFPFAPELMSYRPLATVLEGAKSIGMATGLVATSTISHATPAAFGAHIDSRSKEQEIIEHLVYQNINVVFGGARNYLTTRTDGENLRDTLISRNYQFVQTREQMSALTAGNVWGMFAGSSMQPDIDRAEFASTEPSLSEMTSKAIELLSQNDNGFFLMVEGSQVDWAGHNNDPIYMVGDFVAFDEAVRAAVNFAKADGQTLVLAFPDHNTGGMTLGSYDSDKRVAYDRMPPEMLVNPLKGMRITSQGVAAKIADKTSPEQIRAAVQTWWNITLTDADITEILAWPHSTSFNYKLASVVSKKYTTIGWTTHGHNGEDVPIWSFGGNVLSSRTIENTEIADFIFEKLGIAKLGLNSSLFVDVDKVFAGKWSLDNTVAANPVLVINGQRGFTARLPISKDEAYVTVAPGTVSKFLLNGLVVHAPMTNRVYISQATVDLLKTLYSNY